MDTADKIIFDCVNKVITEYDPEGKRVFYHLLEEHYGVKPSEIGKNLELFQQALTEYYGNRHFMIQTLLIRTIQENKRSDLDDNKTAAVEALCLVIKVFQQETAERIRRVKEFVSLKKYTDELKEKIKTYDERMKSAERMVAIGETAAMVGHDIRNPLQAMISDVYLLKSDLESISDFQTKDGMKESLDSLEKNIAYINKIVVDLQDYAKPLIPEFSAIAIANLVTELFKTINLPSNIALKTNIDVDPPQIKTEPTFLRRALTNLVNNAIQAMPNGGELEVKACINGDKLVITVSDTGEGIPEEVKAKLFKPMVTTKSKGQGFGLAVVKRLVDALNGTISFESTEGKGTKFIIKLPML